MKLMKKILERLNGLRYRQEYLCFSRSSLDKPLDLFLINDTNAPLNVSDHHCFVGYSPLVFALHSLAEHPGTEIVLSFHRNAFGINESFQKKDAPAQLSMKKINELQTDEGWLYFYEGVKGYHRFVNSFQLQVIKWINKWDAKKPGNVFLEGNLLEQVQIAYSVPRKICLVTVGKNGLFNLFPTDLHGSAGNHHYLISLRHKGKACEQVEASGRIVLSDIYADQYLEVYRLGKNHMQPMKEPETFAFTGEASKKYNLPLPEGMIAYRELELLTGFIHGIHKILLFRINNIENSGSGDQVLFHIHNAYATWRSKKGFGGNYLLR